ncbi:MAG: hypothetical protein WD767_08720 [Alphaproteobacteria bacterium]
MEKLKITARLKAPIVLGGGYLTFDALLASLIFEATGDIEIAHGTIPVACTKGLFHASAALLEPLESRKVSFVANLRATHTLDPDLLLKNKTGGVHKKIGLTRRRDFGAVMNSYQAFDAPEITWYAQGDGAAIERLLSGVHFIGKRRGSGFGEVAGWDVAQDDLDGVVGPFGDPMRPAPVDLFKGNKDALRVDAAWRPAYWHPDNRAICYAPEFIQ